MPFEIKESLELDLAIVAEDTLKIESMMRAQPEHRTIDDWYYLFKKAMQKGSLKIIKYMFEDSSLVKLPAFSDTSGLKQIGKVLHSSLYSVDAIYPLHLICASDNLELFRYLCVYLQKCQMLGNAFKQFKNEIHVCGEAIMNDAMKIIRFMADKLKINFYTQLVNVHEWSPVILGALHSKQPFLKFLFEEYAKTELERRRLHEISEKVHGSNALIMAAYYQKPEAVKYLLSVGANIEYSSLKGGYKNALELAKTNNVNGTNKEVIRILTAASGLFTLAKTSKTQLKVRSLLAEGASFFQCVAGGQTPLHIAVIWENENAVDEMLEAGVDAQKKNDIDQTPLDYAKKTSNEAIKTKLMLHVLKSQGEQIKTLSDKVSSALDQNKTIQTTISKLETELKQLKEQSKYKIAVQATAANANTNGTKRSHSPEKVKDEPVASGDFTEANKKRRLDSVEDNVQQTSNDQQKVRINS